MTGSAPAAEAEPRASGARWLELLVALACAPIFAVAVKSWDVWWHLATGRYIAAQHRIPDTDPFSYTMKGEPWRLVNGVADLVLYGFHAALGVAGLVVAKLVFGALTVLLVGLGARRLGAGAGLRVALMIAVALLLQARLSLARPLILGAALIAAGNLAALRLEEDGDGKDRAPLAFFALSLPIWPLIHGTAIVGLAQLGLVTLVLVMGRGAGARSARRALACLAWVTVVAAAAPFWRDLVAVAVGRGGGVTA
ncbi:MAG: hypothetical protein KC731_21915, partial [Myxococcales bacterium]|nr:hypothetical protein [Myxococcales bacterium]